jgi:L-fucose mutarotase
MQQRKSRFNPRNDGRLSRREFMMRTGPVVGSALPVFPVLHALEPRVPLTHSGGELSMLKGKLIHPQILEALGRAGHGSQVLIADGNYPASTKLGPKANLVNLNLSPGLVNCTQVLEALLTAIPVEAAAVMATPKTGALAGREPDIWNEFRAILAKNGAQQVKLEEIERFKFYDTAGTPNVALTIATGEQRIYANLLLTIGVVMPG